MMGLKLRTPNFLSFQVAPKTHNFSVDFGSSRMRAATSSGYAGRSLRITTLIQVEMTARFH